MERELRQYKNLKNNVNSLARDINLAISSLGETENLYDNYKIDDVSKEKKIVKDIIEDLNSVNRTLKSSVTNSINNEIRNLEREIASQENI